MEDIEADLLLLRGLVARELETINVYRSLAAETNDGPAREFILHVVEEEKSHISETLRVIVALDPDQAGLLQSGFAEGHQTGQIPEPVSTIGSLADGRHSAESGANRTTSVAEDSFAVESSTRSRPVVSNAWTVGSLRGLPYPE